MKYWCPECKSELNSPDPHFICGYCGHDLIELPDFETPSQYEKRTGEKWNGAVWYKRTGDLDDNSWFAVRYNIIKYYEDITIVFCAASPEPPPDEYVPNGEQK